MNVIPRTLLLATMCLGFARAAEAQDAGNNPITLPEVSVSTQADGAFFAPDTASQGVVTGKQIEEQPRSRVGEVLEVVPGLIATQQSQSVLPAASTSITVPTSILRLKTCRSTCAPMRMARAMPISTS